MIHNKLIKKNNKLLFTLILSILFSYNVSAENSENKKKAIVYKIDIKSEINKTSEIFLINGLDEAKNLKADAVLLHLNTFGGLLESADIMRTAILYSPVPVYVFIDNNAASAGALISIACKKIYMRQGASFGAATVVSGDGKELPDKYQSYMRSMMRSTAQALGKDTVINGQDTVIQWKRDPLIAESMVDDRVVIPFLIDSGKTLTLTAEEAIKWNYCDGIAESMDEVITHYLGFPHYDVVTYVASLTDKIRGFLLNPVFQSVLILIIIAGIYFELQTPGIGFPLIASITAAVLYFLPLYVIGLAENWEIVIFVIGVILIALELFVIPGFGITGISGICLVVLGLFFSLIDNDYFSFEKVSNLEIGSAFIIVTIGLFFGMIAMIALSSRIGKKGVFHKVALTTDLGEGNIANFSELLIGKEGIALTDLRPSGKVQIENENFDAVSIMGFVNKNTKVRVTHLENAQIYVVSYES